MFITLGITALRKSPQRFWPHHFDHITFGECFHTIIFPFWLALFALTHCQHRHYMICVLLVQDVNLPPTDSLGRGLAVWPETWFSWVSFALPVGCTIYQEWSCTHLKQQTCWFPIADLLLLANRRWVSSGALALRPWHKCGLLVQCLHSSMFGFYGRGFHGNIMLDELQRAIGS